jgi:photosystem II stability/assembly factor-like uncharacterized protein
MNALDLADSKLFCVLRCRALPAIVVVVISFASQASFAGEWKRISTNTNHTFNGCTFIDRNTGWLVGRAEGRGGEVVVRTTDGGSTWNTFMVDSIGTLLFLYAKTASECIAVGTDGMWKSINGGETWQKILPKGSDKFRPLVRVVFKSQQEGYAQSSWGNVLRTTDGGSTWEERTPLTVIDSALYLSLNILLLGNDLYVSVDNKIVVSNDSGFSWNIVSTMQSSIFRLVNLGTKMFCTLDSGEILCSYDSCKSWKVVAKFDGVLTDMSFADTTHGWACGVGGSIVSTTDGGLSWIKEIRGAAGDSTLRGYNLFGISATDTNTVIAVGTDGLVLRFLTSSITSIDNTTFRDTSGGSSYAISIPCRNGISQLALLATPDPGSMRVIDVLGREVAWSMENFTVRLSQCHAGYHLVTYRHAGRTQSIPVMVVEE